MKAYSPEPFISTAVEERCVYSFFIQLFDNSDKVRTDIKFPHGVLQGCVPYHVEFFLQIYKDAVAITLVLLVFITIF